MRTIRDIERLLNELESRAADELEDQDLDFKQWDASSKDKAVRLVVHMAVCMANGGGGTVVFGVADKLAGRSTAILGVPPEVDVNRLKKAVYDQTDPKIMPVFEDVRVPEGTGRGAYWTLRPEVHEKLAPDGHPERARRIDWEAAKTRVLSVLMERAKRGEPGLTNSDVRQITRFDRNQVYRLMCELRDENPQINAPGRGRWARYDYTSQ